MLSLAENVEGTVVSRDWNTGGGLIETSDGRKIYLRPKGRRRLRFHSGMKITATILPYRATPKGYIMAVCKTWLPKKGPPVSRGVSKETR